MRVLFIDNYDSFVYNLVQYVGELGAEPVVFTNNVSLKKIVGVKPSKIIISPGPGIPEHAGVSVEVVLELGKNTPTLGVCLGHQVAAYAFGGKIVPAKKLVHGKTSRVRHDGSELFKGIPNPFEATRYHSLAVDRLTLPECFQITAETDDEDREIMGLKHKRYPIFGVQFHPESILTHQGKLLVKNFLEL